METHWPREDSARVLAVAAALWGALIGGAAFEGVLEQFEGSALALFAVLVSLYAAAAYFLDPQLRSYAATLDAMRARLLAAAFVGALVAALAAGYAALAMFFAPLAALATIAAAAGGPRRATTSASPAKSPGVTPAAT
jgi:hypothetical protein